MFTVKRSVGNTQTDIFIDNITPPKGAYWYYDDVCESQADAINSANHMAYIQAQYDPCAINVMVYSVEQRRYLKVTSYYNHNVI